MWLFDVLLFMVHHMVYKRLPACQSCSNGNACTCNSFSLEVHCKWNCGIASQCALISFDTTNIIISFLFYFLLSSSSTAAAPRRRSSTMPKGSTVLTAAFLAALSVTRVLAHAPGAHCSQNGTEVRADIVFVIDTTLPTKSSLKLAGCDTINPIRAYASRVLREMENVISNEEVRVAAITFGTRLGKV